MCASVETRDALCLVAGRRKCRFALPPRVRSFRESTSDSTCLTDGLLRFFAPRHKVEGFAGIAATALAGLIAAVYDDTILPGSSVWAWHGDRPKQSVIFYRRSITVATSARNGARLGMVERDPGRAFSRRALNRDRGARRDSIRAKMIGIVEQTAGHRNPDPANGNSLEFFKSPEGISLLLTTALMYTDGFCHFLRAGRSLERYPCFGGKSHS